MNLLEPVNVFLKRCFWRVPYIAAELKWMKAIPPWESTYPTLSILSAAPQFKNKHFQLPILEIKCLVMWGSLFWESPSMGFISRRFETPQNPWGLWSLCCAFEGGTESICFQKGNSLLSGYDIHSSIRYRYTHTLHLIPSLWLVSDKATCIRTVHSDFLSLWEFRNWK